MDKEQIRKALDHFENDEFTDAKEILQQEISQAKGEWLTDKLKLETVDESTELDEGSTEDAAGALKAIIGSLEKGDGDNDMLKMAKGIMDYYKKNKSFAPDQAKWIANTSKTLFK